MSDPRGEGEVQGAASSRPEPSQVEPASGGAGSAASVSSAGVDLWCMNIIGPDDVFPAPDFWTALAWATELNASISKRAAAEKWAADEHMPLVYAAPARWPWSAEAHAAGLKAELEARGAHETRRRAAPGGEAAQAAETGTGSAEGEHPVAEAISEGQAPDLKALQAEIERLTQICTGLGLDLRIAESERDDARMGGEIWALRCGVVLGRSPIPDAPADLGRLPAETFWRAAGVQDRVRWDDRTFDERQRWAYAEAACIEKARSQAPEVQSLVADIQSLRSALQDSERKRVETEETSYQRGLWAAATAIEAISRPGTPAPGQLPTAHAALAGFYSGLAHAAVTIRALSTPTQETPNAQG